MNGRDDGDDDKKQPEQDVAASTHSDTTTNVPPHPDANDGNKVKAAAEPQKPDSPESIAAETLQRVRVTEIAMVVLTAVIAFSGLATVVVYWRQLDVMQDTLNEIRISGVDTHHLSAAAGNQVNETRRLAEQTTSLANYGKASAETAQRLEKWENRTALQAGIVCEPQLALTEAPPVGKTLQIAIGIDNPYSRPASDVTVNGAAVVIDSGLTPDFSHNMRTVITGVSVPRTETLRIPKALEFVHFRTGRKIGPVTADLFDAIKSGRSRLFAYGEVIYTDAAGCHRQEFCDTFDASVKIGSPPVPNGAWMPCTMHRNETDCRKSR